MDIAQVTDISDKSTIIYTDPVYESTQPDILPITPPLNNYIITSSVPTESIITEPEVVSKAHIDQEYAAKPHGGYTTVWLIAGLAIALIIIFGIVVIVFFILANKPDMHEIAIVNNCSQPINLLVGTEAGGGFGIIGPNIINPGSTVYYKATPAVYLVVQGYYDNTLQPGAAYPYPLTKVKLWLADRGYDGPTQITDGTTILNVPRGSTGTTDVYDVSLQDGYNIQMGIFSSNFNNRNPSDSFSCDGPNWDFTITSNTCPAELTYPSTSDYQACMAPCLALGSNEPQFCCSEEGACNQSGGCQSSWPNIDYYNLFAGSCPTCMITNCDSPEYQCSSSNGLTQYVITFCP